MDRLSSSFGSIDLSEFPNIIDSSSFPSPQILDPLVLLCDHEINTGTSSRKTLTSSGKCVSGRKKKRFTSILEQFFTSNARHPKKEFFNAFVIRSLKRSFRYIDKNHMPGKTCIAIDFSSRIDMEIWNEMTDLFWSDPEHFRSISATEMSPQTDGKSKRRAEKVSASPKSFNNKFCKEFFSDEYMQRAFFVFIKLLFSEASPEKLRKRFRFDCCRLEEHGEVCVQAWANLEKYLRMDYMAELEVDAGIMD
jgi:hypothetical protein